MKILVQTVLTTEDGETFVVEEIDIKKESLVNKKLRDKIQTALEGLTINTKKSQWRMVTVDGREHVNIVKVYFIKKIGMCKLAKGGMFKVKNEEICLSKRSSATVYNQMYIHNKKIEESGFCDICRDLGSRLDTRRIPILDSRWKK